MSFLFSYLATRQTHRQNHTDAAIRFTPATVVGVSTYWKEMDLVISDRVNQARK